GWRCLRPQPLPRSMGPSRPQTTRNQHQSEFQAPWVSPRGRNSRAWRQMRAQRRQAA
ncbi:hypothetical protein FBU31_007734, partial [Coemansia sp. 'formosensis']